MSTTIRTLFVAMFLSFTGSVLSHVPVSQPVASVDEQKTEVAVLRAQLETTKQFHDSYMTVTVSALGTAIAIVLALAVFSWFTSKSNYERDRAFLEEKVAILKRELEANAKRQADEIRKELVTTIDTRQAAISKAVESALTQKISTLSVEINRVKSTALELKIETQLNTAKTSLKDKMYDYAIAEYCEAIRLHVERGTDSFMAGDIFDKIYAILKIPDVHMSADNLKEAIDILEALPKDHKYIAEQLVIRLKNLHS